MEDLAVRKALHPDLGLDRGGFAGFHRYQLAKGKLGVGGGHHQKATSGDGEDLAPGGHRPLEEHLADGLGQFPIGGHTPRMPHMEALLNTVVPVALVVASGYLLGKRLPMDLTTLSRLTLYLLVPALILDSMYRAEYSREGLLGLTLGFALTYGVLYLAIQATARLLGLSQEPPKGFSSAASFPTPGTWAFPSPSSPWGRRA